jgi:serine O-acetyltransferase
MLRALRADFAANPRLLSRVQLVAFRLGSWSYYGIRSQVLKIPIQIVARLLNLIFIVLVGSSEVSAKTRIGPGLCLPHGFNGNVINANAVIGSNVMLLHHVTIGTKTYELGPEQHVPVIGDNVTIFTGATLVGDIRIGDNSTIGAHAVVTSDVPADSVAVGVPARMVARKGASGKN